MTFPKIETYSFSKSLLTWAHLVFINEKNFPSEDAEETVVVVELVLAVVDAAVVAVVDAAIVVYYSKCLFY